MQHQEERLRVYSVQRTAEALDISRTTLWRLIAKGKIRTIQLSARRKGIPATEIERIAANGVS